MSIGYAKRTRGLYERNAKTPFQISRSKIELYTECPRCFWLDRVKGVPRTSGFPFNLNSAVDILLKKEFDQLRQSGTPHPLMVSYGIHAVPFSHKDLEIWREVFKGIRYVHAPTDLLIFGAVDDIWVNEKGELHVVDYKATSKEGVISLSADWQDSYRRQVEVYQWLLRSLGFSVSNKAYFVYANGIRDREGFDARLEFDVSILTHDGNTSWIEPTLHNIKQCLEQKEVPEKSKNCDYCAYIEAVQNVINGHDEDQSSVPTLFT